MNPFGTVARRMATRRDFKERSPSELTKNQQVCGLPLPFVELKVVDPDDLDSEKPHDGVTSGELLARGKLVQSWYTVT